MTEMIQHFTDVLSSSPSISPTHSPHTASSCTCTCLPKPKTISWHLNPWFSIAVFNGWHFMIFEVHDSSKTNSKAHDPLCKKKKELRHSLDSLGNSIWCIYSYCRGFSCNGKPLKPDCIMLYIFSSSVWGICADTESTSHIWQYTTPKKELQLLYMQLCVLCFESAGGRITKTLIE